MVLVTGPTEVKDDDAVRGDYGDEYQDNKLITIEDRSSISCLESTNSVMRRRPDFARGLRSILRHDLTRSWSARSRCRDAQIAIQSSLTGHLVLTTVHANNVFDVIGRFASMGIDAYNFLAALNCVLAQRLVRMVCLACRVVVKLDNALRKSPVSISRDIGCSIYEGKGCQECHGMDIADEMHHGISGSER